jgi:choline dehydrogenase-like flavoprotein
LASLQRKTAGLTNYPKEYDGTRVLNILTEAFLTEWDDVGPSVIWTDIPIGVTWASYNGVNVTLVNNLVTDVDTPGVYELEAYNDGDANALTLAQDAAQSGRGVLWESGDGSIHYDDYSARANYTPITLTDDDLSSAGLKTAAQWSEIVNDVTVTYRAGEANSRDEQSIILYGSLVGNADNTTSQSRRC